MGDASRSFVGLGVPRVDGPAKAAGAACYPQDRPVPPGTLHAATVRAPVARARLLGIDAGPAFEDPSVVRVITASDVTGTNRFGLVEPDQPLLAEDRIRGASDVAALVVARSESAAREAARRVRLRLTQATPLVDPERALDPDAPRIHEELEGRGRHPNLLSERTLRVGDVERAFRGAAHVVEATYRTGWVDHFFLCPEAGLVTHEAGGVLALHVATQWAEADLRQAASALDESPDRLRIVQDTIGGAFGGREDISVQILLFLAARLTGAPVRMAWDRRESVRGHGKRHPFRIRHRLGADARGAILGAEIDLLLDAGCYASTSRGLLDNALAQACGPYRVPTLFASGKAVFTNNPFTCAFRGFGVNQVAFAMEQQLNKLATRLGLEPTELRRRNLAAAWGVDDGVAGRSASLATGTTVPSAPNVLGALDEVREESLQRTLPPARAQHATGRGTACAIKNVGFGFGFPDRATAEVTLDATGATVRVGAADTGQGSETVLTQIAAAELGLALDQVRVEWRRTDQAPEAGGSSASRQTTASGNAVKGACRAVMEAVGESGVGTLRGSSVTRSCTWHFPATHPLDHGAGTHLASFGAAACSADVEVDRVTGTVRVLRIVLAVDAGCVLNPLLVRGQVEGGVVMGQGYALQERLEVVDGLPVTLGFESGGVPTFLDAVPDLAVRTLETPSPIGPHGARGLGEVTMIPVVPAITAAIHDACGIWLDRIPATPERVREALAEADRAHRRDAG